MIATATEVDVDVEADLEEIREEEEQEIENIPTVHDKLDAIRQVWLILEEEEG